MLPAVRQHAAPRSYAGSAPCHARCCRRGQDAGTRTLVPGRRRQVRSAAFPGLRVRTETEAARTISAIILRGVCRRIDRGEAHPLRSCGLIPQRRIIPEAALHRAGSAMASSARAARQERPEHVIAGRAVADATDEDPRSTGFGPVANQAGGLQGASEWTVGKPR